jgi:hypothetical protein
MTAAFCTESALHNRSKQGTQLTVLVVPIFTVWNRRSLLSWLTLLKFLTIQTGSVTSTGSLMGGTPAHVVPEPVFGASYTRRTIPLRRVPLPFIVAARARAVMVPLPSVAFTRSWNRSTFLAVRVPFEA